ncbi:hypothetical protein K2173_011238 [Erythroxylum novogranatense]|uniref:Receptor-like serine/threonine-protein kinase n=1 Tax=Erythroxylum novogranatense TaxID=1862640 RepID=A0AAV8TTQ1_9ROSI|nr:hypothetical protein K2173_011238 [Erythroxylum novogranatense]
MSVARAMELNFEIPSKNFLGMACKVCAFGTFNNAFTVFLFLCSCFCGFCDELAIVSVPLGFEISGVYRNTLVSQNGIFAFGFLEGCQKDDDVDGLLVGIRYNLGNDAANVPVWTVGGGLRVSRNSTIKLSMDGRLILFENLSGLIVWSSNTSTLGVERASLLNNGNLVLMGSGSNSLWESFNSPTNTLLPDQSLHFPQTLRAPSKKSISSYYNFVIRRSGELALVWESNVTYWRTHLGLSASTGEARFDADGVLGLIDDTNRTVWSAASKDFKDPSVSLRHLRMDSDGNLRIYSWDPQLHEWKVGWQAVENQCEVFGACGLYSLCRFNSTGPVCDCLHQDLVDQDIGLSAMDASSFGCKKMVDLGNCKMNTSMTVLQQTVLYGVYPPQDVDMMLSEKACRDYCSNDSTCIAATSKNDGSGLCTIKRTSFISGYRSLSAPAVSFLKVCLVPQAVSARRADPYLSKPIPMQSKGFIHHEGGKKKFVGAIALIVFVTVSAFLTIETLVFWFLYRRRQMKAQTRIPFGKYDQTNPHYSMLVSLTFEDVKELTANFSDKLGPTTYKGLLPNKLPVIAKMLNDVKANEKDFRLAISTLGGMHHRNLVPLKGFCFESSHRFVLYEYVQNGSLDKWLFNMEGEPNKQSWQQRLDIALGVARALAYLHSECQICVAHGNLKLENVLLDEKLVPKLTDFGLRSLLQKETASSSESLSEGDIYRFGEMLLQIVVYKRDVLGDNLRHLADNISEKLHIEDNMDAEVVERVVRVALWCLQEQPFLRPSIDEVMKVLEGTLSVDKPPLVFDFRQDQMDEPSN